jgi:hypothetical protein
VECRTHGYRLSARQMLGQTSFPPPSLLLLLTSLLTNSLLSLTPPLYHELRRHLSLLSLILSLSTNRAALPTAAETAKQQLWHKSNTKEAGKVTCDPSLQNATPARTAVVFSSPRPFEPIQTFYK